MSDRNIHGPNQIVDKDSRDPGFKWLLGAVVEQVNYVQFDDSEAAVLQLRLKRLVTSKDKRLKRTDIWVTATVDFRRTDRQGHHVLIPELVLT